MHYYHVWVRSKSYRGKSALTYSYPEPIAIGSIVRVHLRNEKITAVVVANATKTPRIAIKTVEHVYDLPTLPTQLLSLAVWLQNYYRSPIGATSQTILPAHIPAKLGLPPGGADSIQPKLPALTKAQARALKQFTRPNTYLLHGRTGSGKTRIYQELTRRELERGKSTIILSPEIGLTGQLVKSFGVFGDKRVVLLHSNLTARERFDAWQKILCATTPLVIIGPRSALFSPVRDLGLIVVDEAHEPAYKQEQEPRYQAFRVASQLAHEHKATLVYGTATPLVADYYIAEQKGKPIIRLSTLAKSSSYTTDTTLVDLKNREQFTKSRFLSDDLLASLTTSLAHNQQSLLYLNRRGTARIALCQNCGWQALCPKCDIPLVYHGDSHNLRCHTCGWNQSVPLACPTCQHTELVFKHIGTKAVVDEVQRLFPDARLRRFDSDNLKSERLEHHIEAMQAGGADIIIGTQSIAKGLDLPNLTTVGVIMADTSLSMPDYTASERTYQLLNQVIGRVGRGHANSHVIIQSYNPNSLVIKAAIEDDWANFYQRELEERNTFLYPPFCYVLKIVCKRASAKSAEQACEKIRKHIVEHGAAVRIDGPAPALYETINSSHYWQLVVKAKQRSLLLDIIDALPSNTLHDIDPLDLL